MGSGHIKAGVRLSELKITQASIQLKRTIMLGLKEKKVKRKLKEAFHAAIDIAKRASEFSVEMYGLAEESVLEAQRLIALRAKEEEAAARVAVALALEAQAAAAREAGTSAKLEALARCAAAALAGARSAQDNVEAAYAPLLAAPILQTALSTVWSKVWLVQTKRARLHAEERRRKLEVRELVRLEEQVVKALKDWWRTEEGKASFEEEKNKVREARLADKKRRLGLSKEDRRRAEVRAVFDEYDADNSDSIDPEEFALILRELCIPMTKESLDAAFAKVDESGDGQLSFDEFYDWWMSPEFQAQNRIQVFYTSTYCT
jgi:hypothetical protein